jgi:hypothetical protein
MVSLKSISFNLSTELKLGDFKIPNSIQIAVHTSNTHITGITATFLSKNINIKNPIPNFKNPQNTFLLTLINYIGTTNIDIKEPVTHPDPLQNSINAFIIGYTGMLVFEELQNYEEFNKYLKNPFSTINHPTGLLNVENSLLKLKYFHKRNSKFPFASLIPILKTFRGIFKPVQWDKWNFIKCGLGELYKLYEWQDPAIFDTVRKLKDNYIKFAEFTSLCTQHKINSVYNYISKFEEWNQILSNFKNTKLTQFAQIEDKINALVPEEQYSPAPINYPNQYQLELYDKFSESLELEMSVELENVRKAYQPELNKMESKLSELNLELASFVAEKKITKSHKSENLKTDTLQAQKNLNTTQISMMSQISKIETRYANCRGELQKIIKILISNFKILNNIDFEGILELNNLRKKIKLIFTHLSNKLWYFQNETNNINYGDALKNIQNINDILEKVITIIDPLIKTPYITYEQCLAKIEVYFEEFQNVSRFNFEDTDITLHKILKDMINLKYYEIDIPQLPENIQISINFEDLIINEIQLKNLQSRLCSILEYTVNYDSTITLLDTLNNVFGFSYTLKSRVSIPEIVEMKEIIPEINLLDFYIEPSAEPTISDLLTIITNLKTEIENLKSRVDKLEKI